MTEQEDALPPYPEAGGFRERLIRLKISQIEFAKMTGYGISTVQHWAQEKHKVPPLVEDVLDMIEGVGPAGCVIGARNYFEWKISRHGRKTPDVPIGDDDRGGKAVKRSIRRRSKALKGRSAPRNP